jgi:hypothetical protein
MGTDPVTLIVDGLTYTLQFSHPSSIPITQIALYAFVINFILTDNNNRLQNCFPTVQRLHAAQQHASLSADAA